jgi:D-serine deaminase-like pyridoxal phosphate-dependent protein
MQTSTIPTPAALIEIDKLRANCAQMLQHVYALGSRLRSHMKTLKSVEAARLAVDPRHGGIAVATLTEARHFFEGGFTDICCAVCLAPEKFELAAQLTEAGAQLSFFVDSVELARAALVHGAPFPLWIEVDCGEHRTGVEPDDPALLEIADILREGGKQTLLGVATHAEQSYACRSIEEIRAVAERERLAAVEAAHRLRAAGLTFEHVSIGSTPTTVHALCADGVTEFRAGVYMAGDLVQSVLRSLDLSRVAFSVLASVIGIRRERRQIVVDAGGLALSKDRGTKATAHDYGYGLVTDLAGELAFGDLIIADVHQEHGEIRNVPTQVFDQLKIGDKVRILPNHVCMTAAMYDQLHIVSGTTQSVVEVWRRVNGCLKTWQILNGTDLVGLDRHGCGGTHLSCPARALSIREPRAEQ